MSTASASGDVVARSYARLSGLKESLPTGRAISGRYVDEYHDALKPLQALGLDLSDFMVPPKDVGPIVGGGNYLTGEVRYTKEHYVDRALLLAKLTSRALSVVPPRWPDGETHSCPRCGSAVRTLRISVIVNTQIAPW